MSKKYTTNFLEDTNGSTGTTNQVLVSTATGVDWVDGSGSGIIGGPYLPVANPTFTGTLTGPTATITKATVDPLLYLYNTTNGSGATIRFSDQNPLAQVGDIAYFHSDGVSQGGGASFHFRSEPDTTVVAGGPTNTGRFVSKSAGTATEVDYGFYDDVNTGMYRIGSDNLGFATGGVNRLNITSASATFAGTITATGGNSTQWNTAYDNSVTALAFSGASTTTLTLTQQDGGTVSNTFSNPQGTVVGATSANTNTITVSTSNTSPVVTAVTAAVSSGSSALATGAQIQTAINTALLGVLSYQGTWNASTNSPTLASGTGTPGYYYIVSVAGSTNLDGITDWAVGDWAVFSDLATDAWQKIDNTQVGNVTGSGAAGRVAYWNSTSNITSDAGMTYAEATDTLTVTQLTGNASTVTNGVYTTGNQTIGGIKTFSSTIYGSINGNASTATSLPSFDTRSTNPAPNTTSNGVRYDFKTNATNGLSDGGSYNGQMTWRSYSNNTDLSGGMPMNIAYTANGNLWTRIGATATTWDTWYKLWSSGNDGAGSGLDADLLDGQQGSYYVNTGTTQTIGGAKTFSSAISAPGGNSTEWNTAYDNSITAAAVTGTTTKTLTLTQQDAGTVTASWTDNNDDTNYYTTTATFNTGNGVISFSGAGGQPAYSVDLDGRYAYSSDLSGYLPLAGGTMSGGIAMANLNITGVNQLQINDPGEGILFVGTTNVELYTIDDATDSIVNFSNATEIRRNNVRLTDTPYISSRSQQLMTNYSGLLGNNYNFSGFTFDGAEANSSPGSFKYVGPGTTFTNELMAINANEKYRMSTDAKSLNGVGRYYMMTICADVDDLSIGANQHMYRANTATTLAVALTAGDTTVTLASNGSNYYNGGTAGVSTHLRSLIFWEYTNSFGYTYPVETYSRLWYSNAWDPGGVTGNVITLRVPWAGPTYPVGSNLSNGSSGGSYKYNVMSNTLLQTTWNTYTGYMDGIDYSGTNVSTKFPPGTAKIQMGWFMNYNSGSTGTDTAWFTNVDVTLDNASVSDLGSYLPLAGGVMTGNVKRSSAITGFLEGSYNNVGSNGSNTNPIYTIGSNYNPASTTLSNMYGVGYASAGASFITLTGATDWGFYVAADGDARVWLDGSSGNISGAGNMYASGGNSTEWNTAYDNSIVSAAVTGTTTKTLTLTQQDAGTVTASWTDEGNVTGTGATNYLTYWDTANTIANTGLYYDGQTGVNFLSYSTFAVGPRFLYSGNDTYKIYNVNNYGGLAVYNETDARFEMVFDGTGNIGIGNTAPDYTLDVSGDVGINDYVYHNGDPDTFIGFSAANTFDVTAGNVKQLSVTSNNVNITDTLSYTYPSNNSEFNGEIVTFGAFESGVTFAAGELVCLGNVIGSPTWRKANNTVAVESTGMLGITLGTTISAGILVRGFARSTAYNGFSDGGKCYISATDGDMTTIAPTATNAYLRIVGYVTDSITGAAEIYFCPDNTYVQIA